MVLSRGDYVNELLCNSLLTIISGVLVFTLGQLFIEFVLRPIQEYKNLKAKVAKSLVFYARYYSNPQNINTTDISPEWMAAENNLRELASEVAAFAEIKPPNFLTLFYIPSKKNLAESFKNLIGLSNSVFVTDDYLHSYRDGIEYVNKVKKLMRISVLR